MNKVAKVKQKKTLAVQPQTAMTPARLLEIAVSKDADIEKLKELMSLQERWEANEARKAYTVAMNNFKADPPEIFKDVQVAYRTKTGTTAYDHASLENVSSVIGERLAENQLSHRWDVDQLENGVIVVTCVITHALGHSERVPMRSMPDQSGGKNSIQAIGSTTTYLQRYTLLAATGLATKNMDDDGAGSEDTQGSSGDLSPKAQSEALQPQAQSAASEATGPGLAAGPLKVIQAKLEAKGLGAEAVCKQFNAKALPDIKMAQVNEVLTWIDSQ